MDHPVENCFCSDSAGGGIMKDERVADGRRGEEGKQSKKGGDEERERERGPSILLLYPHPPPTRKR